MVWIILCIVFYCLSKQGTDASKVRLVDGYSRHENGIDIVEGRLEVYNRDEWGNVCDDEFTNLSARVVCQMLGFEGDAVMLTSYRYGNMVIGLDNVICLGTEKDIMNCQHSTWRNHNCNHEEDVGVRCEQMWNIRRFKEDFVLMSDISNSYLQVCNINIAKENICQMLGFESKLIVADDISSSQETDGFMDINCSGNEQLLSECTRTYNSYGDCMAKWTAFRCFGQILSHGNTPYNGRLEIYHGGQRGTVCDDGFGDIEASVVCRYLELSWNGRFSYEFKDLSDGSNYILDDIVCTGRESSIVNCRHTSWNTHNCDTKHREDVGIQCSSDEMALTLGGGNKANEGIAQIMLGKQRTNICSLEFDKRDGIVFCRELNGNYRHVVVLSRHTYNTSSNDIYQETFHCTGNETKLVHCPRYSVRCPNDSMAAIVCDPTPSSMKLEVPSPMIVNEVVNISCSASGGSPVPDIWWNCCNQDNDTVILSENQVISVLEFMPSRECNAEICTCIVHHNETTFPEIHKTEILVVYYPVRDDLNVTVPILIEHQPDILTCEVSDGNPLPDVWWTCSEMPYDNVTSIVTHNSSTSILHITPTADYHNKMCTCIGKQNNTTFEEISKTSVLHVLYSVSQVTVSSTDLLAGLRSYLICRVAGGNPRPDAKWFCNGELQTYFSIRSPDAVLALMSFIPTAAHEGKRCTCVVSQPGTNFHEMSESLVLRVTRVNNETTDQYVKEESSTLEETTAHQTYTSNDEIITRSVTEGYQGLNNETNDQSTEDGYNTVKQTTTFQTYTTNEDTKAKSATEGYTGFINKTKQQSTEIDLYTANGTTVHQINTTNENTTVEYVTENYRSDLKVSSTYKTELNKEITVSLSTESNEEPSTAYSQYVNNTRNGTLSTDDSHGLTRIHVSAIIIGIIGITVICIVIFVVFKLKNRRALAKTIDYSYVNAAYQPSGSQNCENEPLFTE